eukprot:Plantae.Rhodophyta-Hildenbrandia_rubra.ctg3787.p2 GENE.Plantae.Rhodophyta-Hildenbrandia_rubra.ctg3787~~Plantae.Rhodophyta-Hildenbrandia_rubra.ctg3787.p2  ORF type:complete len:401 (-),score=57.24 Plantae.Rhodophyta-Hildenbrandia_rubra.ctg3787:1860-3062(-)
MEKGIALPAQGIPVLLLTGPLGAGKTTLLNRILASHPNPRTVALVINEVGAVAIDPELVDRSSEQFNSPEESMTMSTLANGCICCNIRNDFIESMCELLDRLDKRKGDNKIRYVIVETTGIADPEPVMNSITETELSESLYLDQVLSVIDHPSIIAMNPNRSATEGQFHPSTEKEATIKKIIQRQIDAADTVYVTKLDLVASNDCPREASSDSASDIIRKIRPSARIILGLPLNSSETFPWDVILDIDAQRSAEVKNAIVSPTRNVTNEHHHHEEGEKCDCSTTVSKRPAAHFGINSVSYTSTRKLSLRKFREFLDSLSVDVLRAKGIMQFAGYKERFILQVSGGRFEVTQDEWSKNDEKRSQVVVIGFGINEEEITKGLEQCLQLENENKSGDSDEEWT